MKSTKASIILILALSLSGYAIAQDIPDAIPSKPEEKKTEILELKELVKAQSPLSKRIFLIVDVSGSMYPTDKIGKALKFVKTICQTPFDEFEIAIAVFNGKTTRWEGYPCAKEDPKPCPKGWTKFPSKDASDAAQAFLNKFPGSGTTDPLPAFEMALKEDRSDLSIVFITDGDYDHPPSDEKYLSQIRDLQESRDKKSLGKAVISVFGVGTAQKFKNLYTIGQEWLGGFYMEKSEKDAKSESFEIPQLPDLQLDDIDPPSDPSQDFPHSPTPWRRLKFWKK